MELLYGPPAFLTIQIWVDAQSTTYADLADHVRDLIRRDQACAAKIAAMQRLVTEAFDSGISPDLMADIERNATRDP